MSIKVSDIPKTYVNTDREIWRKVKWHALGRLRIALEDVLKEI